MCPTGSAARCGALAWVLGTYSFARYARSTSRPARSSSCRKGVDGEDVSRIADGVFLARDLINTPSNDMGPEELAAAARDVAKTHSAKFAVIVGDALLKQNYPLDPCRRPRLGARAAPDRFHLGPRRRAESDAGRQGRVFRYRRLDLKPSSGMLTMKKDMGGAATVLAIAHMVMDAKLDLRLRVLIPAVENSVSGTAYRPGDVFPSRKGLTVEIGNTDAEGRLVLADALAEADSETPELLIDIATLTGAARVATGMELPPFFTDDETLAADLSRHAPPRRTIRCGGCRCGAATNPRLSSSRRRSQQQSRLRLCRRDHRGAVPQPLCRAGEVLDASRHRRLDRPPEARPPRGRRSQTRRARSMRC